MLQEGIYWDSGMRPGPAWGVAFLRVRPGVAAATVDDILVGLAGVFTGLRYGRIGDLPGVEVPPSGLTVLLGFGPKAFDVPGAARSRPAGLHPQFQFAATNAAGGGLVLQTSGLSYAQGLARNPATEEIAVQAIGDTSLAVARFFVETQKYLDDHLDPATGLAPLEISAGFTGFNREDGRSWIDFYDGVSNLKSGTERRDAIEVKNAGLSASDKWTRGGTYLAFMRLLVDLRRWRALPVRVQELAVGRSKTTGCPLTSVAADGSPVAAAGCPVLHGTPFTNEANAAFFEPDSVADAVLLKSHVQRANHHIGPINRDVSQRVFRQGYEFLEPPAPGRAMQLGLNFVSFQDSLTRVMRILTLQGWLGNTNFGGVGDSVDEPLLSVLAAGVFFCPAVVAGEAYPGQSVFKTG